MESIKCTDCGEMYLEDLDCCPKCGSARKTRFIEISDSMVVGDAITGMKGKNPNYPGKHKVRWEWTDEDRVQRGDGVTPIHYRQFIDRDNDIYEETVIHRETGEVIHDCKESLTKHRGHSKQEKQSGHGKP